MDIRGCLLIDTRFVSLFDSENISNCTSQMLINLISNLNLIFTKIKSLPSITVGGCSWPHSQADVLARPHLCTHGSTFVPKWFNGDHEHEWKWEKRRDKNLLETRSWTAKHRQKIITIAQNYIMHVWWYSRKKQRKSRNYDDKCERAVWIKWGGEIITCWEIPLQADVLQQSSPLRQGCITNQQKRFQVQQPVKAILSDNNARKPSCSFLFLTHTLFPLLLWAEAAKGRWWLLVSKQLLV